MELFTYLANAIYEKKKITTALRTEERIALYVKILCYLGCLPGNSLIVKDRIVVSPFSVTRLKLHSDIES